MQQVTKEEFFKPIVDKALNVHPTIEGNYPYTSVWRHYPFLAHSRIYGKTVDTEVQGKIETSYFITAS